MRKIKDMIMKNNLSLVTFLLLLFPIVESNGQDIEYGSNNGKYLKIFNHQIYYEEYGKGTPFLLLHGGSSSIIGNKEVIPELANHFKVIAIDSPGHGRSEQTDSLSYQLLADYFIEIIDQLKLDSVYVMGLSDGGNAALIMAADRPETIKKVIVSGSQFRGPDAFEDDYLFLTAITPEQVEKEWSSWKDDYLKLAYDGNDWKKFIIDLREMWNRDIYIPGNKVDKISSEVMIVFGDRDLVKLEHGLEMYRAIKGSELLILPNTGHSTFNQRPELMSKLAVEFFINN
jgi:pimeloyl-ACP methyl ester carboxylesterase